MDGVRDPTLTFERHAPTRVPAWSPAAAAIRTVTACFQTFTSWCTALNLAYAAVRGLGPGAAALGWFFPLVHFNAWAVLVGSHVLLCFRPEALSEPRLRVGRCGPWFALAGHVVLHVAPASAFLLLARARPSAGELSPLGFAWGTGLAVLFGTGYALWKVKPQNPYGVDLHQMRVMMISALVAGLGANLAAYARLS